MFDQIANDTINPAFAVDRRGKVALWNQAAEKSLGYPASAALGQCCWRLLTGQDTYGNQFCHRHCALRKMAFEHRQVNGCHLYVRTASNGRQKYAIDSQLISDASGADLLLHTCQPESVPLQNGNGKTLVNGFSAHDPKGISLESELGVAAKPSGGQSAELPEDRNFKLDIAKLLEIGDLLEKWFNQKLIEETRSDGGLNGNDIGFMDRLERVMEKNHADPQFGLPELASEMYMCARQLQRKLKDATGYNPAEFLRCYRLKKARELLKTGKQIGLVADAVGFSSPAYFTSCFKAQFGQTPSDYRQQFN